MTAEFQTATARDWKSHALLHLAPSPALGVFEDDILRAFLEALDTYRDQILIPFDDCQEMISGKLTHLRREAAGAVGEQDLRLAVAPRIEKHLSGGGIAGGVLETDAEVKVPQRNPCRFSTPADVNHLVPEGQALQERGAGLRRGLLLQAGHEFKWSGANPQQLAQATAPFPDDI
jgi:hypothetical protein